MPVPEGEAAVQRESRLAGVHELPLSMESLVGSYLHMLEEDGDMVWQGCVVAEPQAGKYLVALIDVTGQHSHQRLFTIDQMCHQDFRFYDTEKEMHQAYDVWFRESRERERSQ